MNLETLVRPFQSPRSLATRRVISSSVKIATETSGATWGAAGNLPNPVEEEEDAAEDGVSFKTECCKDDNLELFRETEDVKVYNQKNPNAVAEEDYIVVRRAKKMKFDTKKAECGLQSDPTIAAAFTEIGNLVSAGYAGGYGGAEKDKGCKMQMTFKYVAGE